MHDSELLVFDENGYAGTIEAVYGFQCGSQIVTVDPPMEVRCRSCAVKQGFLW